MSLGRALILKTAALRPIEGLVRKSFFFRPLVRRFIAGDQLEEALKVCEDLATKGLMSTLDYLGENTHSEAEAMQAVSTYKAMLERIHRSPQKESINISIKLTQCGLDQGEAFAENNYRDVLTIADDIFVRIDMEASAYTERTVQMIERVFPDHKNTGTVLQSYLKRSMDDVERMIRLQARVRVVKGAYLEPGDVAFEDKATVDQKYIEMADRLLAEGFYPAIATHDENIINHVRGLNIPKDKFEFQMLFGIRRDLQESLLKEGYRVRVYVPFGDQWYPYFTRRLAERPANMWFIFKSLFKG